MKLELLSFNKIYNQIVYQLKKQYNKVNSVFTTASPFGQILSVVTELFKLNSLNIQNIARTYDVNDVLNNNVNNIRALARVGQYNPSRGQCAFGSIELNIKGGVDLTNIPGGKIIFTDKMKMVNNTNNLTYVLDLNQDSLTFTVDNNIPIILNVAQGEWKTLSFTGDGTINQSITINPPKDKQIDNYKFKVYVNSELWQSKTHKFDLLNDENAYVPLTSFTGGLDIIFGNGYEGKIPPFGSIITIEYFVTNGVGGNITSEDINQFTFNSMPKTIYNEDVNLDDFFTNKIRDKISFGSAGDTINYLKSILPYASSNFVLAGPDQYKFFIKRLGIFSTIDIYTSDKNSTKLINNVYSLLNKNNELLNKIDSSDNTSTLKQLVSDNLDEVRLLRKMLLTEGGNNVVNLFLIPDIKIFYGNTNINYFNMDLSLFILDDSEKNRILKYLSNEGIQVISNEINIVNPIIKKYVLNLTIRIYDDAIESNIINSVTSVISDYFINDMRRDRIPISDIVRLVDGIDGVDSVDAEFISEDNENYHKEFLIKSKQFYIENNRNPKASEIIMSDGASYDQLRVENLDSLLGDILIGRDELPIIRGGFSDRYNNLYNLQPGEGLYSPINILILPEKTKRKKL